MRRDLFALFSAVAIVCSHGLETPAGVSHIKGLEGIISLQEAKAPTFDLEQYQFGILRKGPAWTAESSPEVQTIQAGHMENIRRMASTGKLVAAGPLMDNGDLRGIFIFKATAEEATRLASEDPAIKSGRMVLNLFAWMGPKGIGASYIEQYRRDPEGTKTTMTQYHLVLLRGRSGTSSQAMTQQLQIDHLWNIRRMMDAGKMSAAGPFVNGAELRGLFVLATASADEARAWAESDPAVRAGLLTVEIHPWFVAKEVWPVSQ